MSPKTSSTRCFNTLTIFAVNSLKAVEVRGWIFREIAADISVFDILISMPLTELAVRIAGKSSLLPPQAAKEAGSDAA